MTCSFVLMANNQVLVPMWQRSTRVHDRIFLCVFSYGSGSSDRQLYKTAPRVATFHLPELAHRVEPLRLDAAGCPYSSYKPPSDYDVPFYSNMDTRLFVINIIVSPMVDARPNGCYLFAPSDVIESICRGSESSLVVPWDSWKSSGLLVFRHLLPFRCPSRRR